METVTITKLYVNDKNKNGEPLVNSNGKPFKKISIQTNKHGNKYLSSFFNNNMASWKVGDTVEIITEQNGQWLNFKLPPKSESQIEVTKEEFNRLVVRVTQLERSGFKSPQASFPLDELDNFKEPVNTVAIANDEVPF